MSEINRSDQELWVSWDDYHQLIEQLALIVHRSGWQFDQILCLARGGLRVGDVLSRLFDRPLAILSASSYREERGKRQTELILSTSVSSTAGPLQGRVLVVDDLADSGATLAGVIAHLQSAFPQIREIRTAVLWWKARSVFHPDFHVQKLSHNPWIHQPFERYDTSSPQDLAVLTEKRD